MTSTTFQSADHTSSNKKIRQYLLSTDMGTAPVYPEVKSPPRTLQAVKKIMPNIDESLSLLKSEYLRDIVSLRTDNSGVKTSVKDLSSRISSLERAINDIRTSLDRHLQSHNDVADVIKLKDSDTKVEQLSTHVDTLSSKIPSTYDKKVDTLHVGADFNLPEQPSTEKEGGVHKVAPLSFVVNGAVLLHDIGYTTDKKGLVPLYYDPITQRALIYQGK